MRSYSIIKVLEKVEKIIFSDFAKTRTLFKFKKTRVGETAELNWPNTNTYATRSKPYMDKPGFSLHYKKSQHN